MCSYCGCDSEGLVAQLMEDHDRIGALVVQANTALDSNDFEGAARVSAQIARLFERHGAKEEDGLFAELRAEGVAVDSVAELESEHRALQVDLAVLAAGDVTALGRVLTQLLDHAGREDTDLFPAALTLLSNEAWVRINKIDSRAPGD